jgi:hypothetical protein
VTGTREKQVKQQWISSAEYKDLNLSYFKNMFSAQLIHDPEEAVAKTLDEAILKLNALMKKGHADTQWGHNIAHSAKDLEEKYQHDFIRYLANPAGYNAKGSVNQEIEDHVVKTIPPEGRAVVPQELMQRYTLKQNGVDFDILVENVPENEEDDDEKRPN